MCNIFKITKLHRGSYKSAHALLNLLNELGKEINARLAEHCIFFRNEFNKFNDTRARVLDSIYHMALRFANFAISFLP